MFSKECSFWMNHFCICSTRISWIRYFYLIRWRVPHPTLHCVVVNVALAYCDYYRVAFKPLDTFEHLVQWGQPAVVIGWKPVTRDETPSVVRKQTLYLLYVQIIILLALSIVRIANDRTNTIIIAYLVTLVQPLPRKKINATFLAGFHVFFLRGLFSCE